MERDLRDIPFPQLIELIDSETDEKFQLNIFGITGFEVIEEGKATKLTAIDNQVVLVKESPEEILAKIFKWTSSVTRKNLAINHEEHVRRNL
ncbi:hypothetical protein [Parapedobacter tibetensis]|uniref:hypothetical protein n=1 Tax=Parapedobacter tibetensis TaxID=2972951 RepID=UPI00214DA35B|nr:hypothetical protein [Parapedobacter tibetensis]